MLGLLSNSSVLSKPAPAVANKSSTILLLASRAVNKLACVIDRIDLFRAYQEFVAIWIVAGKIGSSLEDSFQVLCKYHLHPHHCHFPM